jgi:hypothetical protein
MTVSAELHSYLGWLVRNTLLGKPENDVAAFLLTKRLEEMRQGDYQERPLSEKSQGESEGRA